MNASVETAGRHSVSDTPTSAASKSPSTAPARNGTSTYGVDHVLTTLLEDAPIGIHFVDAQGIIQWANQSELRMLGYARDEYVGQSIGNFHVDRETCDRILAKLRNGESLDSHEARLRHKDGSVCFASISSSALWEDGVLKHMRCFTRDVTQRRIEEQKSQAQFDELSNLYRTAPIGLALLDTDLKFIRVNERLAEINGIPAARHLSRPFSEIVPDLAEQGERVCRHVLAVSASTLNVEIEGETLAQPGVRRIWNSSWHPIKNSEGRTMAINVVIEEITERRHAELRSIEDARIKDALYRLTDLLQRAGSLDDIYAAALLSIQNALHCDRASILLFDETGVMRFVGWHGLSKEYRNAVEGHSPWKQDDVDPVPLAIDDIDTANIDSALKSTVKAEGIAALLFIPLTSGHRLIGKFMAYFKTPHSFRDEEFDLGLAIARQLAFGIEHRRSETALRDSERHLQQHAEQLSLITDTAPVYIAHCDTGSRYKFVNEPYAARFGMLPHELRGRHLAEVLGAETYSAVAPHIAAVLKGDRAEFDIRVRQSDGERVMHCSYAPEKSADGNIVGFVAAIADISERTEMEEALRKSEEKLKEADQRKDEFLAMLSHELRNPLAPITNAVHLLQREQITSPTFQQATAIIQRQTARLARLVDDLLEVSRITTGRIQLQMKRVALGDVVDRAVETIRPLIEHHGHRLKLSLPSQPVWVNGDSARLEQVIVNLLTNAAKYTDDGGSIDLSINRADDKIRIDVQDNGIGIDPGLLPHVFELFTQSDRTLDRSQGGLGIGLALVERLVSMHGGQVAVESSPGKGSLFTIWLPVALAPKEEIDAAPARAASTTALKVLIVDDNKDAAQSLAMLIQGMQHVTCTAHDGVEALDAARRFAPHVVFLDIGLPKLDGYAVAQRLRAASMQAPTLVALTGYGQPADKERAFNTGFDRYLVKPVDLAAVEYLLEEAAAKAAMPKALDA